MEEESLLSKPFDSVTHRSHIERYETDVIQKLQLNLKRKKWSCHVYAVKAYRGSGGIASDIFKVEESGELHVQAALHPGDRMTVPVK
jgi:hypothetical protein